MGLFNKRNTAAPADTAAATGSHHREKKASVFGSKNEHGGARTWNSRPTFGAWIKATALDIITMAILGAIGLGVYFADPAPSRSFPGEPDIQHLIQHLLTANQLPSVMARLSTPNSLTPFATRL